MSAVNIKNKHIRYVIYKSTYVFKNKIKQTHVQQKVLGLEFKKVV